MEELMAPYAPKQREAYIRGLTILAKVAIRAQMKRQSDAFDVQENGDKGEG